MRATEDSIEHYLQCPAVRLVANKFLHLPGCSTMGAQQLLFADKGPLEDSTLIRRAVIVYAAYNATNHFRIIGATDRTTAVDALEQHCRSPPRGLGVHACRGIAP